MPRKPTATQRRLADLRAALDAQRTALPDPPPDPDTSSLSLTLSACAAAVLRARDLGLTPQRAAVHATVRGSLDELAERAPGHTLEVRVPPCGAVQVLQGPRHTRGTPPGVVETDPITWIELAVGRVDWGDAVTAGRVTASGVRADLAPLLPLWP